jgi:hypothetical protein
MSLSKPFFNSRPTSYRKNSDINYMTDTQFNALHWTEQLKLRPLRDRKVYVRESGDFDNYNDNWDTDLERENNDVTQ